ncbi:NADH-ubiquinone oxidoreductase (complex I), chain 5 carboxy-terminal protein [Medicago truncatula]|uniref:NAD(P)H-quinone oxidoreductase subunit 5, chloroplastic n=1 Tax=Medicago truncatula TaxID=3880 RepID=G7KWZ4_MEDTR|nr:NADH-ubiquinone oxidoreductase (complex I), chain 5 carboxy-terminal protein [Medicago truncatula]
MNLLVEIRALVLVICLVVVLKIISWFGYELHQNSKNSVDWYEFFTNATFSVS